MSCQIRYVVMIACMFLTVFATVLHSLSAQEMEYPIAAAATEDGAIYVADIDVPAIWKIKDGKIEKYFEGSKKYRTPLNRVRSLAIDRDGKLLAGDSATREVYRFDDSAQPVPLTKGGIGIPRAIAGAAKRRFDGIRSGTALHLESTGGGWRSRPFRGSAGNHRVMRGQRGSVVDYVVSET